MVRSSFEFLRFDPPEQLRGTLAFSFFAKGRIPYPSDKILPTTKIAILFTFGAPHQVGKAADTNKNHRFTHSWAEGFQTSPTYNTPLGETHVLGLILEPPGFFRITGCDMSRLTDKVFDLRALLPGSLTSIIGQSAAYAETKLCHKKIRRCISALQLHPLPDWFEIFYTSLANNDGQVDLARLYHASNLSERHIIACFKRYVGVSPKVFCRIRRMLALLEAVDPSTPVNWTELAHRFGFYDQPHFNREFRRLSGQTPNQYLDKRRELLPDLGRGEHVVFSPHGNDGQ